jgi:hypothetical protein
MRNAPILRDNSQENNRKRLAVAEYDVVHTAFGVAVESLQIHDELGRLEVRISGGPRNDRLPGWSDGATMIDQRTGSLVTLSGWSPGVGS